MTPIQAVTSYISFSAWIPAGIPERRDDGSISFEGHSSAAPRSRRDGLHQPHRGLDLRLRFFAWMSPTILGLILAIFPSWATGLLASPCAELGCFSLPRSRPSRLLLSRARMSWRTNSPPSSGVERTLRHPCRSQILGLASCRPHGPSRKKGDISSEACARRSQAGRGLKPSMKRCPG